MKLTELKEKVDRAYARLKEGEDLDVVITNNKSQMGAIGTTKIKSAQEGFDWERGLFILKPEVLMIEKSE